MIDLGPLHLSENLSSDRVKIGITANSGLHTNELICGVSFALEDELAVGNQTAKTFLSFGKMTVAAHRKLLK